MRFGGTPPSIAVVTVHGSSAARSAALLGAAALLTGCSSSPLAEQGSAADLATRLVASTRAAGMAPGLTPDMAESLYGTSAPQICGAFDDGVSTAGTLVLGLKPAGRRAKVITTNAITYERLVVQTYCPDDLAAYDDFVSDVEPTETTG